MVLRQGTVTAGPAGVLQGRTTVDHRLTTLPEVAFGIQPIREQLPCLRNSSLLEAKSELDTTPGMVQTLPQVVSKPYPGYG